MVRALGSVGLAALVIACSPANLGAPAQADAGGGTDAGDDGGFDVACQNFSYAYCGQLEACSPTLLQNRWGTLAACKASELVTCELASAAPGSAETPASLTACAAAIPGWACTDFIYTQARPPACQDEIAGTLPNGAPCAIVEQCQSGYCALPNNHACGTCQPIPVAGASCATAGCPAGLSCQAGTCVAYGLVGAACSSTQPCNEDLACAPSATPGSNVCQPSIATMGASCSFTGLACDLTLGLTCNAMTSQCETVQVVQPGQACGIVAYQNVLCAGGACVHGTCVANIPEGGACDTTNGAECFPTARCIVTTDGGTQGVCQYNGTTACQ